MSMNTLKLILVTFIYLGSSVAYATDMASYYRLNIEMMKQLETGYIEQLECLTHACPEQELVKLKTSTEKKIQVLYAQSSTTASKELGFYTKHQVEAKKYYENNSTLQNTYKVLMESINGLRTKINEKL